MYLRNLTKRLANTTTVYHPFRFDARANHRGWSTIPLRLHWTDVMTWTLIILQRFCDDKCRVLVLSNPHNPAGLCWSEIHYVLDFCYEHNIIVISDGIHSDMALWYRHIPFANYSERATQISICLQHRQRDLQYGGCVSVPFAIVPNEELHVSYGWLKTNRLDSNTHCSNSTMAAYRKG